MPGAKSEKHALYLRERLPEIGRAVNNTLPDEALKCTCDTLLPESMDRLDHKSTCCKWRTLYQRERRAKKRALAG